MGKPLSRPDCLRQNPPCVGKGDEEEEDINIEDCYVPQRSIYDTVRLNEQIDSGSKGSLSSRHFSDRTSPYSHRTLDLSTLCSNGALSSSSVFELRGRETNKLDEKMIFDALKLNSDIIRTSGLPKTKCQMEKKEHRRSWRLLVPPNFVDCGNKNECSVSGSVDTSDVASRGPGKYGTNSLTSEDDDSGLCSPPAEKQDVLVGEQTQIRSISSVEDMCVVDTFGAFSSISSSEHQFPLLPSKSVPVLGHYPAHLDEASLVQLIKQGSLLNVDSNQEAGNGHSSRLASFKENILAHAEWPQDSEREHDLSLDRKEVRNSSAVNEPLEIQGRLIEKDFLDITPQDVDTCYEDASLNARDREFAKGSNFDDSADSNGVCPDSREIELSGPAFETNITCNLKAGPMNTEFGFWISGMQIEQTLDTVCNGFLSDKVTQIKRICNCLWYYLGFCFVIAPCMFLIFLSLIFIFISSPICRSIYQSVCLVKLSKEVSETNILLEDRNW